MNYLEIYIMIIKWLSPWGGGGGGGPWFRAAGKKMQRASNGYGFDMQYLHTHNRTHTPTRTHTQYIISTLNYVLFLCMVQEGGIWDYKTIFIQLIVSLFQGSHNLNKYHDLLMICTLRWWLISPKRGKIPVKRVLLQTGLRRKLPVEAKKL